MDKLLQNITESQSIKNIDFKTCTEEFEIKCKGYLYQFKKFLTLRGYFQNLLRTNGIEEKVRTICVRNIDNPKVVLQHYDCMLNTQEGTYLMLETFTNPKYYQVTKVLYTKIDGVHVYVKEITKEQWENV